MSDSNQPGLTASEEMLARTFDTWRKEFRGILENHRREIQDRLEKIETAATHLLSLINNILDISKIEADKMEMVISEQSLPK